MPFQFEPVGVYSNPVFFGPKPWEIDYEHMCYRLHQPADTTALTLVYETDYEKLEPIRNVHEAMAEDAPQIHSSGNLCQQRHVTRGDAKTALEKAAYKVTRSFTTPFTEHAFLEPECAVSFPSPHT